jgi:hypothetical protein
VSVFRDFVLAHLIAMQFPIWVKVFALCALTIKYRLGFKFLISMAIH